MVPREPAGQIIGMYRKFASISFVLALAFFFLLLSAGPWSVHTTALAAPAVLNTDPADGATGVVTTKTITVTFDVYIQAGSAYDTIALKDQSGADVAFSKSITDNVLTIDPTSLLECSVTYWVYIPALSVENLSGEPLQSDYNFSFTTEAAPVVSSTDPTDGATDIRVNKTATVTFGKNIQAGAAYAAIALKDQSGADVPFAKTIASNVLSIDPTSDLNCSVSYWVYVPAGAIADTSGNPTAADCNFSFTTSPGKWYCEIADATADIGHWTSLALDVYGQPHVSYYYVTGGDLMYAYKDTAWNTETVDSGDSVGQYTSMALDDANYPHISYYDVTNTALKYVYKNVSGWQVETVDGAGDVGTYNSLKLDSSGYPHIAYCDTTNGYLKYAYKDATGWHIESVVRIGGASAWISLAIDANGYPHMSYLYSDNWDLKYTYKDVSGWHTETVESSGYPGYYSSLAIDASGRPHISYVKGAEAIGGPTNDLKYAYKDIDGWHITAVNTPGWDYYSSLVLDRSGYPHIGHWDASNKYPRYSYQDVSGWHKETVPDGFYSGEFVSLALDASDNPRMTYYRSVGDDLKYAWWLTDAPTVTGTDPRRGAADIAIGKTICLTFTEDVQEGDNYGSITLKDGGGSDVSFTKTLSGKTLTIDPDSNLANSTTFTVTIPAGVVKDVTNNVLVSDFSFSFTTEPAPAVSATNPESGATDVRIDQTITVTFNKNVQAGDNYGQINLKDGDGGDVAFSKSIAGSVLTVDPTGVLEYTVTYTVYIPAGCVKDASGTGLPGDNDFSFTTEALLAVWDTDPASGAVNVPSAQTVTVTFSQDIQAHTNYASINLKHQDGSDVAFTKGINGAVLTVDPNTDLSYGVTYTVYVPADSVATLGGSGLPSDYNLNFTTEAGGSWQLQIADEWGLTGLWTSITLDVYGYPRISYYYDSSDDLKYAYKDSSGWHTTTVDSGGGVGTNTSIEMNSAGYPCISYRDDTNANVKYAYQDASGWHMELVDAEYSAGSNQTGLGFDSTGYPHISYLRMIDAGTYRLMHAWKEADGWHNEILDSDLSRPGQWSSLAIDSSGGIHISYYLIGGNATLRYAYKPSGGAWSITDADPSAWITGEYSSIALDESGYPHFSSSDRTNWDLRYVYKDGAGWHRENENIDSADQVGTWTSIGVKNGYPHISYYDITNTALKYAYKDASGWHAETVDNSASVGQYTSIVLDVSGSPYISYYDATNFDLRCAYWLPAKPMVAGVDPLRNSASVTLDKTITVGFTEDVVSGDNYAGIALKDQSGADVPFTKTLSGRMLTIDPNDDLSYSVTYTVYVPAGSVKDSGGNALAGDFDYSFTAEPDIYPPAVSGTDPANGATGVTLDRTITVTFDEDIQASANYASINLKHEDGSDVAFGKSIAGAVLIIDPDANLSGSVTYTVYVPAGSVKDLADNDLAADFNFSFTTEAPSATITITAPAAISGWSLSPASNQPLTQSGTLSIDVEPGTESWEVTASDADTVNTNGKMTAYNGSYDLAKKLQNAMSVAAGFEVTLPAGGNIAENTGDQSVDVTFKQTVGWTDEILSGGYTYRIVVTFIASITV
ncbi:MAG: Ig-like domain-containing protein [Bacillota bacterium]